MMSRKPKGILFDMDGVLINSEDSWYESLRDALQEQQNQRLRRETFHEQYWGRYLGDILAETGLKMDVDTFCHQVYGDHTDAVKLFPGTRETLEHLSDYPKAIITNTPAVCTRKILERFGLSNHFAVIISGDEIENAKPDPEIVFKGCKGLGIDPADALVIGDLDLDVRAARAAGCPVAGIGAEGDYTLERLEDLLDLLTVSPRE